MNRADDEDEAILVEVYPRLRAFASVIGPRSGDPDDLVQEALVRTLRKHRLAELDHPLAYLRRVVHNLSTDQFRAAGRRRSAVVEVAVVEELPVARVATVRDGLPCWFSTTHQKGKRRQTLTPYRRCCGTGGRQ